MSRHQEVNQLLNRLSETTATNAESRFAHYLLPDLDVSAYQRARAYPGTSYILMGNSFNLEEDAQVESRKAMLNAMFGEHKEFSYVVLKDAFGQASFLTALSRFERDWLSRLPADTVIGPAFDDSGKRINEAFAVWRSIKAVLGARTRI